MACFFWCWMLSGCADLSVSDQEQEERLGAAVTRNQDHILEGAQKLDYDQRVRDFKSRGLSDSESERRASEGQQYGIPH